MDLLIEFLRHNALMNRRLIWTCRGPSPEQLGTSVAGTYGSIGATLVHIVNAQASYAARLLDGKPPEPLSQDPFPGFETLEERLASSDLQLEVAAARDQDREIQWTDREGNQLQMPVSLFLLQAINHGTDHRSQVATMLTQLGIQPPAMDGQPIQV